jgi:serine/threonine-protein kinase ULK2
MSHIDATEIQSARKRPLRDRRTPTSPTDDAHPAPFPTYESTDSPAPISFPPPPNPNAPPSGGSPSSFGARPNALTRALTKASAKLFGTQSSPRSRDYPSASPRRQQIISSRGSGLGLDVEGVRDPQEDALLESLEELAQKTEVLTRWADEMYEYVKKAPQSKYDSCRSSRYPS